MTPVLAAVGAVVINTTLAVVLVGRSGSAGSPSPSRRPPGSRRSRSSSSSRGASIEFQLGRAPPGRRSRPLVGHGRRRPRLPSGRSPGSRRALGADPPAVGLIVQIGARRPRSSAWPTCAVSIVLRIPELPSIVGVMADVSAARSGRDGPHGTGRPGTHSSRPRDPGSYLQLPGVGRRQGRQRLDRASARLPAMRTDPIGAQILVRRPRPMPWAFAYAPRGPWRHVGHRTRSRRFTERVRDGLAAVAGRVSATSGSTRDRGRRPARSRREPSAARSAQRAGDRHRRSSRTPTRIIDLRADEDALWGDLRKKWRQYVNKARSRRGHRRRWRRSTGCREFYAIYRETADRAGFLIRTEAAYRDVWDAYRPAGRARLLFAQTDGRRAARDAVPRAQRTAGRRAVRRDDRRRRASRAPTTCSSGRPSARSREAGATSYDLWGLATGGIAHFKTGFGGREVRYIGAWDLVLDPLGRRAYELAQQGRVWWARRRHGIGRRGQRGRLRGRPIERSATRVPTSSPDWDALTVEAPGGHVYQSRAWADASRGVRLACHASWSTDDGGRVLALTRPWPLVGGGSAYLPRGPGPARPPNGSRPRRPQVAVADDAGRRRGSTWWRPIPRSRPPTRAFGETIAAAGFAPIEEIQPSRHRISLPLETAADEPPSSGTSPNRPASASAAADARSRSSSAMTPASDAGGQGRGSSLRPRPAAVALDRFYDLLLDTGERRQFTFGPASGVRRLVARPRSTPDTSSTSRCRPDRRVPEPRPARRPRPLPPRRAALDRPFGRPCGDPRATTRARSTSCAGGRSSSRSARAAPRWTSVASTSRARGGAARGRPAARALPAQAVLRWPLARADRRARAGFDPTAALRRRPARRRASQPRARATMTEPRTASPTAPARRRARRARPARRPDRAARPRGPPARRATRRSGDRRGRAGRRRRSAASRHDSRAVAPGIAVRGDPGLHVDGHDFVDDAADAPAPRRRIVERAAARTSRCRSSSSDRCRDRARDGGRLVVRRPERRAGGRRDHRHGWQDDDLVPRDRGARGRGRPDRDDRHGRGHADRRRPGAERGARHDPGGARAAGALRAMVVAGDDAAVDRDHVARPGARPRRRRSPTTSRS